MRTVRVGRLAGIPIGFQPLWLVVLGLITWTLGSQYFPDQVQGITPIGAYGLGLAAAVLLFTFVLLHELGHAVVARRHGVEIEEIDLWLLGGVARMKQEPKTAKDELAFAAAGPAVTLVIVLILAGLHAVLPVSVPALTALVDYQLYVNVLILVLNMLPAFPLDGGRIARAIMWQRSGDHAQATASAARVGRGFGFGLIAFGMLSTLSGAPGGLWFVLIGGFLLFAATAEAQHATTRDRLAGQTVDSLMAAPVHTIPEGTTAQEAVSAHFMHHLYSAFPVVEPGGRTIGLLTVDAVRATPAPDRTSKRVEQLMDADPELLLAADMPLVDAISRPAFMRHGRAIVVGQHGEPVGLLSATDVHRWMRAADLLPQMTSPQATGWQPPR
jgi:Zn-dependent protease/predicted transcriptional regulator